MASLFTNNPVELRATRLNYPQLPKDNRSQSFQSSVLDGDCAVLFLLHRNGTLNELSPKNFEWALLDASQHGSVEVVTHLVALNCLATVSADCINQAIFHAVVHNHPDIVETLIYSHYFKEDNSLGFLIALLNETQNKDIVEILTNTIDRAFLKAIRKPV